MTTKYPNRVRKVWPPELTSLIGHISDQDWSKKAGVSKERARQIRVRLNITAFGHRSKTAPFPVS